MRVSTSQQAQAIAAASKKWGIPAPILIGIYGLETAFGANVSTSSAGAMGAFQFIPGTAKQYGYPMTNDPTAAQFAQQADAAAHYLHDLYSHTHSWDAAAHSYSGGGYGIAQVLDKYKQVGFDLVAGVQSGGGLNLPGAGGVTGAIVGTADAVSGAVSGAARIADLLTSADFWIRLGEAIAALLLLVMGLRSLTGSSTTPVTVARAAARRF